ncbi:DUF2642 domain-containing protein [Oceanobacillus sp. CFH 90083]|uniref:DUF2642 domain-containing protein n=1 Tax=Oceanobacillus sp. CFH 90083 TaxID=2592336 RepID=UPI00128DC4B9|nr:DUF2642 domain-containing protein [Oceanobacillus sp. CFH 90083]
MANLTDRQRNLLGLLNLLSQNTFNNNSTSDDSTLSNSFSLNLPGLNLDLDQSLNLDFGFGRGRTPATPTTIREVLLGLVNEQVQVTTPFDTITGTLLNVQNDYITMIEASGAQVLTQIEKIEFVSNM